LRRRRVAEGGRDAPACAPGFEQTRALARAVERPHPLEQADLALGAPEPALEIGAPREIERAARAHSLFAATLASSLRSLLVRTRWPINGSPWRRSAVTLRPLVALSS